MTISKIKQTWEKGFYKDIKKHPEKIFRDLHQDFPDFLKLLKKNKAKKVLDLGCGTGRHSVALAKNSFEVYGIDLVGVALEVAKNWLLKENLTANLILGDNYKKLPYENNFFDGLVSTKAMHHGKLEQVKGLIKEIERVLRPGGILIIELPRKKRGYERFKNRYKEIEPGTIMPTEGPEKGVPHHIVADKKELVSLFQNFKVLKITFSGGYNKISENSHFTLFAEKI